MKTRQLPIIIHGNASPRDCGTCSLCCTVMAVTEIGKARNCRCEHLNTLGRCKIYATKPQSCTDFLCLWRRGILPKGLQPEKVHAVADMNTRGDIVVFHVDPRYPTAHERGPLQEFIQTLAPKVPVIVVCADARTVYGADQTYITALAEDPVGTGGVR